MCCCSLWEIVQTLYFAAFALVDIKNFELNEPHTLTQFVGKTMFGVYSCIIIIVLINMLIAMLSNSYQYVSVSMFMQLYKCVVLLFSLWEIVQTLYFAAFGLVDVANFELTEPHSLTEFVGKTIFGAYSAILIIVLINMLIAMLSNSYQYVSVSMFLPHPEGKNFGIESRILPFALTCIKWANLALSLRQ